MNTSAEQLIGKHTRASQALEKAKKSFDKLARRLEELGWDDQATLDRYHEASDRVFDAQAELDTVRSERIAFVDHLRQKQTVSQRALAEAQSAVKLHQASLDRTETDVNRLLYL